MKDRIYVCHTYYHVYISMLKELKLRAENKAGTGATLVLSRMSNDFEKLPQRMASTNVFTDIVEYDEKREDAYPGLEGLKVDRGNFAANMIQRIKFTKRFGKALAQDIPVNFKEYKDIYVYCDADPIGFYLNCFHIKYHAVEDGLNCVANYDLAHYSNRGHFNIKAFFSKKLNLIFVMNGYGKYCIDMEVNDISRIKVPCPYYIEVPRQSLVDRLTPEDKDLILTAFVRDKATLSGQLSEGSSINDKILILTDPVCDLDVREQIFRDLVAEYSKEGTVFLKPHPRDVLDYRKLFADVAQFDASVPMEMLNFFPGVRFKKVVGVLTELKAIAFADECVRLGPDFMDKYEEPALHRQNEQI